MEKLETGENVGPLKAHWVILPVKLTVWLQQLFLSSAFIVEKAEKMGQSMTKVPYKETFWKGTMRTRPRE